MLIAMTTYAQYNDALNAENEYEGMHFNSPLIALHIDSFLTGNRCIGTGNSGRFFIDTNLTKYKLKKVSSYPNRVPLQISIYYVNQRFRFQMLIDASTVHQT